MYLFAFDTKFAGPEAAADIIKKQFLPFIDIKLGLKMCTNTSAYLSKYVKNEKFVKKKEKDDPFTQFNKQFIRECFEFLVC